MKFAWTFFYFYLSLSAVSFSQELNSSFFKPSDSLNESRRNAVVISEVSMAAISLVSLNELWYKDFERSKFRTIDDTEEWLQLDKMGHVYSSYQLGRLGANVLNWSGVSPKDQLIYGGSLGFAYLGVIEVFDGFSKEWGFSWSDIAANALGSGLFISQELLWEEQRIMMKYSFNQTSFASQNPNKLGDGFFEEVLKDYNGQTYWLSANLRSFFKDSHIPKWLNVAVGYGGAGMLSGVPEAFESSNNAAQKRYRQWYLSLDLDLGKMDTKSPILRSVFDVLGLIKVPFPAVEFNGKNGIKGHYIFF